MKPYSSLLAFVAHYRALKSSHNLDLAAQEQLLLAEMEKLIDSIGTDVRATLDAAAGEATGAQSRRRERAERTLSRELLLRGLLSH